ncbi:signal peptidase I [Paenibacillus yanchengensis]|uniref:Signal peptidase I n=1 Tax=Paenibacillus yanchengensis TaxID=2035833 RepID=A0ABW4YHZ1_9BACL
MTMDWWKEIFSWLKLVGVALIIAILLNLFVFQLTIVKGQSMEPTLAAKQILFVGKWNYLIGNPKLGDIVILKEDNYDGIGDNRLLVKRVVGLPGDTIQVVNHYLYRNGVQVEETYLPEEASFIEGSDYGSYTVQQNEYFVLGDNRALAASSDSRSFGGVDKKKIIGKAQFILWPFNQIKGL